MDKIALIFLTTSIFTLLFLDLFRHKKWAYDASEFFGVEASEEAFTIIDEVVSTEEFFQEIKPKIIFSEDEKIRLRKLLTSRNLEIRDQAFSVLSRDIKELPFLLEKGRQEENSLLNGLENLFLQGRRFSNYENFFQTGNLSFLENFSGSLSGNSEKPQEGSPKHSPQAPGGEGPYHKLGFSTKMLEQISPENLRHPGENRARRHPWTAARIEPSCLAVMSDSTHQEAIKVSDNLGKEASMILSQFEFSKGTEKFRTFLEKNIETPEPEVQFYALMMALNELERNPGLLLPESIFPALDSGNPFIRGLALIVGSRISQSQIIREKILEGVDDKEHYVRFCAASALAKLEGS